jgi:sugar lactone lactonase YvrE
MMRGVLRLLGVAALTLADGACSGQDATPTTSPSGAVPGASASTFTMSAPEAVVVADDGTVFVSEFEGGRVDALRPDGAIEAIVDGLRSGTGLALDRDGALYVADHGSACILALGAGAPRAVAGTCGRPGFSGDGGPALDAQMKDPIGIAFGSNGDLFVADEENARVRAVDPNGVISTIAGGGRTAALEAPVGVTATAVRLSHPSYVVVDGRGDLIVSDFLLNAVFGIDRSGDITRIAGIGSSGYSGDGGPATKAELNFPTGLALDARGNLYISDANNDRIRMVDRRGMITTVAGTGDAGSEGIGGPAEEVELNAPAGLAVDARGALYIADQGNDRLLRVDADGIVFVVAD